jgi:hypothetical protein
LGIVRSNTPSLERIRHILLVTVTAYEETWLFNSLKLVMVVVHAYDEDSYWVSGGDSAITRNDINEIRPGFQVRVGEPELSCDA